MLLMPRRVILKIRNQYSRKWKCKVKVNQLQPKIRAVWIQRLTRLHSQSKHNHHLILVTPSKLMNFKDKTLLDLALVWWWALHNCQSNQSLSLFLRRNTMLVAHNLSLEVPNLLCNHRLSILHCKIKSQLLQCHKHDHPRVYLSKSRLLSVSWVNRDQESPPKIKKILLIKASG